MSKTDITIVFDSVYQISGLYITGIVLNSSTQGTISGVTVNVYGLDKTYTTTSDTNGKFYISTSTLTPGSSYTITADVTSNDYQITTSIPTRVIDIPISTNKVLISRLANANIRTNILVSNLSNANATIFSKISNLETANTNVNNTLTSIQSNISGINFIDGNTHISNNLRIDGDLILNTGNIYDVVTAVQVTDSLKLENNGTTTTLVVNQTDTNTANIVEFQDAGSSVFVIGKDGSIINDTINNLVSSNTNIYSQLTALNSANVTNSNLLSNTITDVINLISSNIINTTLINRLITSNLVINNNLTDLKNSNLTLFQITDNLQNANTNIQQGNLSAHNQILALQNANVNIQEGNLSAHNQLISLQESNISVQNNIFALQNANVGIQTGNLSAHTQLLALQNANTSIQTGNLSAHTQLLALQNANVGIQIGNLSAHTQLLALQNANNSIQIGNVSAHTQIVALQNANVDIYTKINSLEGGNITSIGTLTELTVTGTGITGTLNTAAQPNITSVGTLTGLTVAGTGITGTLSTSSQPNITSVGTLTGLTVSGTGITGTLNTSSQPNITSVGTLTGLTVSGTGITGTLNTPSQGSITSVGILNGLAVAGTGIVGILATANQPNITSVGTLSGLTVAGTGITGTLNTATQESITSVGTLTSLLVSGNINCNGTLLNTSFQSALSNITDLQTSNTLVSSTLTTQTTQIANLQNANSGAYALLTGLSTGNVTNSNLITGLLAGNSAANVAITALQNANLTQANQITALQNSNSTINTNITYLTSNTTSTTSRFSSNLEVLSNINTTTGLYQIANTIVLTATTLGSGIVNSSLTSVGTLSGLTVTGTGITGTLNTATQSSITLVGRLSNLIVNNGINIPATGYVGIGLTNPGANLHIQGNASILNTAGTNGMYVSTTGNVGIGVSNPIANLHIFTGYNNATNGNVAANIGGSVVLYNGTNDGSRFISALDTNMTYNSSRSIAFGQGTASLNQGELVFNYFTSGNINNYIGLGLNSKNTLYITGSGNVGIGTTTNIGAPLIVYGHAHGTHGLIAQSYLAPTFIPNGNQGSMIAWNRSGGSGEFNIINVAPNSSFRYANFEFGTYIISGATYTSYGAWGGTGLGIGTTSPSANLHVAGTAYITSTLTLGGVLAGTYNITCSATNPFFNCNGTWFSSSIYNSTSTNTDYVVCGNSGGYLQRLSSSARYKLNIETIEDQYSEHLWNLRPVWYRSNTEVNVHDNPNYSFYGFISEEVANVDPRLATYRADESGNLQPEGVAYTSMTPLIVAEMKKLRLRIANLEVDNTLLKLTNSNFETRIANLEAENTLLKLTNSDFETRIAALENP